MSQARHSVRTAFAGFFFVAVHLSASFVAGCGRGESLGHSHQAWSALAQGAESLRVGDNRDRVGLTLGTPCQTIMNRKTGVEYLMFRSGCSAGVNSEVVVELVRGEVRHIEVVPYEPIAFDADDWRRSGDNRRGCMEESLKSFLKSTSLDARQVIDLLGEPTGGLDVDPGEVRELEYSLGGGASGLSLQRVLVLEFGDDARFHDVGVRED